MYGYAEQNSTVKTIAQSSIESIMAKEKASREVKEYRASLGLFNTLEEARKYTDEHFSEHECPLCFTRNENGEYAVYESDRAKDSDGIPIHSGDIVFMPDDSFFIIQFTRDVDEGKAQIPDTFFWKCLPVDGYADHVPEGFSADKIWNKNFGRDFKLRAWEETEKLDWLNSIVRKWETDNTEGLFSKCFGDIENNPCAIFTMSLLIVAGILIVVGFLARDILTMTYFVSVIIAITLLFNAVLVLIQHIDNKRIKRQAAEARTAIQKTLEETGELNRDVIRSVYAEYTTDCWQLRLFSEEEVQLSKNSYHLQLIDALFEKYS